MTETERSSIPDRGSYLRGYAEGVRHRRWWWVLTIVLAAVAFWLGWMVA